MVMVVDTSVNCSKVATRLKEQGVGTIVRYYSEKNRDKCLTREEASALRRAGLRVGVVYQDKQDAAKYFDRTLGRGSGRYAYQYARGIIQQTPGSAIYFAVDFDASDTEITNAVVPFFEGVDQAFKEESGGAPDYRIGVYGSGLVCRRLLEDKLVALTWLAASRRYRETDEFNRSEHWNLKQNAPEIQLGGITVDTNDVNPRHPDIGTFFPDLDLPSPTDALG